MKKNGLLSPGLLFLGLLLLSHCSFSPPSAPTWDVDINLPLINKTYTLRDLVKDIEGIKADSLDNLFVEFTTEIDTFDAYNQLGIDGFGSRFSKKLGTFKVQSPGSRSLEIKLAEIYPASTGLNGAQAPVPPFQFDVPAQTLPQFESLRWVEIQAGYIDLTIENHLPIALGKPITIQLRDAQADTVIAQWNFVDFIAPSHKQTDRLDLTGKRISGQLALAVTGASPGSTQPVPINSDDGFIIGVQVSELQVSGAAAKIEQQHISFDEKMKISDSVVVAHAKIRQGKIDVTLAGNLPVNARVSFTLPDFVDENGLPLSETFEMIDNQTNQLLIDLSGFRFQPLEGDFGEQFVRVAADFQTLQSPDDLVELLASDSVYASFDISSIYFSEISGKFYSKNIEIPHKIFDIDLPSDLDSIKLKDANIDLMLLNTIGFPAKTHLFITGYNKSGESVTLEIQETIQPGSQDGSPVLSKITLNGQNSAITRLLNLLPTQLEISGTVDIGQPDWIGTIRETDFITGRIEFSAPMAFQLPGQTFESEVSNVDIDAEVQKRIRENLLQGELRARAVSHLPVGAVFYLQFARNDSLVFTQPDLSIGPVSVASGQIDPQTESVQAPVENEINLSLSRDDLLLFTRDRVYSGVRIQFPGTNGQVVKLLASDYLTLKAFANIKVHVKDSSHE